MDTISPWPLKKNNQMIFKGHDMKKCSCFMHPPLRQTGWAWPDANWKCPVCDKKYYQKDGEDVMDERPAVWPTRRRQVTDIF